MVSISKRESGAWQHTSYGIRATATDTITTLPTTIYGDGTNAMVIIKGNTVQNGTPTPENPIMPQGTGERTVNLFLSTWESGNIDSATGQNEASGTVCRTKDYIPVTPNTIYSMKRSIYTSYTYVRFYRADKTYIGGGSSSTINIIVGSRASNPMLDGVEFCVFELIDTDIAYMRINDTSNNVNTRYMMVEGQYTSSTMPTYEPYGYKIPILSGDTTTNIYLGEVESTRQIQKLVLDGTETITEESTNVYSIPITDTVTTGTGLSTHFEYDSTVSAGQFRIEAGKAVFGYNDTLANFSTFLAAQYAAGTPVTIWYILATETAGIVNEPLMKIEDYADVVNNISIPTTDGANALSVDTTVQPSEVSVNYHGWHMGTVHERTAGQWD